MPLEEHAFQLVQDQISVLQATLKNAVTDLSPPIVTAQGFVVTPLSQPEKWSKTEDEVEGDIERGLKGVNLGGGGRVTVIVVPSL